MNKSGYILLFSTQLYLSISIFVVLCVVRRGFQFLPKVIRKSCCDELMKTIIMDYYRQYYNITSQDNYTLRHTNALQPQPPQKSHRSHLAFVLVCVAGMIYKYLPFAIPARSSLSWKIIWMNESCWMTNCHRIILQTFTCGFGRSLEKLLVRHSTSPSSSWSLTWL